MAPKTRVFEADFQQLYTHAERGFGIDACLAAGYRAYDRAAFALESDRVYRRAVSVS
jgi:hypothetical protein